MRICHTLFHEMPAPQHWPDFAARFPWLAKLLEAQAAPGDEVMWLTAGEKEITVQRDGIVLRWLPAGKSTFSRMAGRSGSPARNIAALLHEIESFRPDVVHHHDVSFWRGVLRLSQFCRSAGVPLLLQHHGGEPPRLPFQAPLPWGAAVFGDADMRDRWVKSGLLPAARTRVRFLAASDFTTANAAERRRLRARLGIHGNPVFGWAGNLDRNKDPLLVLRAFAQAGNHFPGARLYLCYRSGPLLPACRRLVESTPALRNRVVFVGRLPHAEMEGFYRSIDYFIQASHREAYGFAPVEAMCAGAVPVLSDIPAFRLLTHNGRFGHLFRPGTLHALTRVLNALAPAPPAAQRRETAGYAQQHFSYLAIAKELRELYLGTALEPFAEETGNAPHYQKG